MKRDAKNDMKNDGARNAGMRGEGDRQNNMRNVSDRDNGGQQGGMERGNRG